MPRARRCGACLCLLLLTKVQAVSLLEQQPVGAFIVRKSTQANRLAVSVKRENPHDPPWNGLIAVEPDCTCDAAMPSAPLIPCAGYVMQNDVKCDTLEGLIALIHTDPHAADLVGLPMQLTLPLHGSVGQCPSPNSP